MKKRISVTDVLFAETKRKLQLIINKRDKLVEIKRVIKEIKTKHEKEMVDDIIVPVQKIYQRITRHTNFKGIYLERVGKTAEKSELRVKDFYGRDVFMANVLSTGQISTLGLSIFLATALENKEDFFRCYFMDDPIQSMDDLNILSFIDLLRIELNKNIHEKSRFIDQLYISTCDEDLENLIEHKMTNFDVNFCKFSFKGYGKYE